MALAASIQQVTEVADRPADRVELVQPPNKQGFGLLVLLRLAAVACSHASCPVRAEPGPLELVFDCAAAFGEVVGDLARDARDAPVVEPAGRAVVGLDRVTELDGLLGGGEPADHRRCVEEVTDARGVECLPAAAVIEHLAEVGDQHVIVRRRITRARRGVSRAGPQQATGVGTSLIPSASTTLTRRTTRRGTRAWRRSQRRGSRACRRLDR